MTLTGQDFQALSSRWIDMRWAEAAGIERKDNFDAAELVGGKASQKNYEGLWIPYVHPTTGNIYGGRIRRDHPEVEKKSDGRVVPKNKYVAAVGSGNRLYFPPAIPGYTLSDTTVVAIVTEGEFKALALRRLANHRGGDSFAFLPVGLSGAWNWRGRIGKHTDAAGERVDEVGPISDFSMVEWKNRRVILAFDVDAKTNSMVRAGRYRLAEHLLRLGASVGTIEWPLLDEEGRQAKGIDDWLARDGADVVLRAIAGVEYRDGQDWRSRLRCTESGKPKALLENARLCLSESDEWRGTLTYDTFLDRCFCSRRPWNNAGGPWTDHDSIQLACWLQRHSIEVGHDIAHASVLAAAPQVNCAVDWVQGLEWDGEPRLDTWLQTYMKVRTLRDGQDLTNYVSAVGTAWMVGAIARLLVPGCQMDFALIFYGDEGVGKTSALRMLSNGWYTDSIRDITSQFAPVLLAGKWIVEFAELEGWGKADRRQLRAFISRRTDSFRAPYGRTVQDIDRTCVFTGTTNEKHHIEEGSEDRRLWPVECAAPIDLEALDRDKNQLWAEARDRYEGGARPVLRDKLSVQLASAERGAYRHTDPWLPIITKHLAQTQVFDYDETPVTITDILTNAIGADKHRQTRADAMRVANCLKLIGFESFQYGKKRLSGWRPAPDPKSKD